MSAAYGHLILGRIFRREHGIFDERATVVPILCLAQPGHGQRAAPSTVTERMLEVLRPAPRACRTCLLTRRFRRNAPRGEQRSARPASSDTSFRSVRWEGTGRDRQLERLQTIMRLPAAQKMRQRKRKQPSAAFHHKEGLKDLVSIRGAGRQRGNFGGGMFPLPETIAHSCAGSSISTLSLEKNRRCNLAAQQHKRQSHAHPQIDGRRSANTAV